MSILTARQFINARIEAGEETTKISRRLGISRSMLTNYRSMNFNASLPVAICAFKSYGVVLHPFSKESIEFEISLEGKNEVAN